MSAHENRESLSSHWKKNEIGRKRNLNKTYIADDYVLYISTSKSDHYDYSTRRMTFMLLQN
jgi:hypothetical protein